MNKHQKVCWQNQYNLINCIMSNVIRVPAMERYQKSLEKKNPQEEHLAEYSVYTILPISLYYGAVECLNLISWRTFWGLQLFSGKHTANIVPGSFLDRITVPYHFAKLYLLFQRSYNRKITKTHNNTGQTNKYSKQKDKIDRSWQRLATK